MQGTFGRALALAFCAGAALLLLSSLGYGQEAGGQTQPIGWGLTAVGAWLGSGQVGDDVFAISRALALCAYLWLLKACLAGWYMVVKQVPVLKEVPASGVPLLGGGDLMVCAGLAVVYMGLRVCGGLLPGWMGAVVAGGVPLMLHCGMVVFATASWQVNRIYGWPLDIKHLRAADNAWRMGDSLKAYAGVGPLLLLAVGVASYAVVGSWLEGWMGEAEGLLVRWRLWGALFGVTAVVGALWAWRLRGFYTLGLKKNAVIHFVQYYERASGKLDPARIRQWSSGVAGREEELREAKSLHGGRESLARDYAVEGSTEGCNVLVVMLESTSSEHLDAATTPNLMRLAAEGVSFRQHYTVISETYRAVYSMLYSDYLTDMGVHPRQLYEGALPQPSLAEVMRGAGYETGFFHSGYLGYAGLDYFLKGKGFETLVGAKEMEDAEIAWMWGVREEQTVTALTRWMEGCGGRRFFGVYSTMFPHHPYYCPLAEKPFPSDSWVNRYRNSLYYADRNIGVLLDYLERRGLREKTVVVATADHGEYVSSFPVGHGLSMTLEDIRVPMILSKPGVFRGGQESWLFTSHLDLAPTVARLVGAGCPSAWLGRDLLRPRIVPRMVYQAMDQARLRGIMDCGLMCVLDERTGLADLRKVEAGKIRALEAGDSRDRLLGAYEERIRLYEQWIAWRHVSRAMAGRETRTMGVGGEVAVG